MTGAPGGARARGSVSHVDMTVMLSLDTSEVNHKGLKKKKGEAKTQ